MKAYYLSLFLLCFSLLVESAEERKSAEDIAINEICIKQETKGYPKWVELICLSKEKINLKGWSLNDSSDCFFKFKDDLYLEPQQLLMICFYEGNDPSQKSPTFSKNISKDVKHVINVYNCNPFGNLGEFDIKNEAFLKEWAKYWEELGDKSKEQIEQYTGTMYDWYQKEALSYIKKKNYPEKYKYAVMSLMSVVPREFDEFALLDNNNKLVSYINWGDIANIKTEKKLKWEEEAQAIGDYDRVQSLSSGQAKPSNTIILKGNYKGRFKYKFVRKGTHIIDNTSNSPVK